MNQEYDIVCPITAKFFLTMVFIKSTEPQRIKNESRYPIYIAYYNIQHYYIIMTFMVITGRLKIMSLISQAVPKTVVALLKK